MSRTKGEYHYAIQALTSRRDKINRKPSKFKNADERIASINAALDVLMTNNLPVVKATPLVCDD